MDHVAKSPMYHCSLAENVKFFLNVVLCILRSVVWRARYWGWFPKGAGHLRAAVEQSDFRIGWIEFDSNHTRAICSAVPGIRSLMIVYL